MSVTSSSMKCPVCPDQILETYSAAIGNFERCPNCGGLFIHQDLIAAASQDPAKCIEALGETNVLLLPTERWCPKCLQKIYDGRVRSRAVNLSLCPACQSFWTNLPTLHQFEEAVERTLRLQIEIASAARASNPALPLGFSSSVSTGTLYEDSGMGSFFRTFARFFDRWADRFSKTPSAAPTKAIKPVKPVKAEPPQKPVKKPLIFEAEPAAPAAMVPKIEAPPVPAAPIAVPEPPTVEPDSPTIEIPQFIFPEEPVIQEKPAPPPIVSVPEPEPERMPEPPAELPPEPKPVSEPVRVPEPESKPELEPELEPIKAAIPQPEPKSEPKDADASVDELRRLMTEGPSRMEEKPPAKKPEVKKVEVKKPEIKKAAPVSAKPAPKAIDVPQPQSTGGFGEKLAAFFKPKPRTKPVKPVQIVKPVEPLKPIQPVKPAIPIEPVKPAEPVQLVAPVKAVPVLVPKPQPTPVVKTPQPQGDGFMKKLFKVLNPPPRPAKSVKSVKPVEPVKPIVKPIELAKPVLPVEVAKPVKPVKPVPPAKPPKPKREKVPKDPIDHMALWPPWALGILGVVCSAFRDFGFEVGPAVLWGLAGWSTGYMVRVARMYPFKPFHESTLKTLSEQKEFQGWRGNPVILKGDIVPAREEDPKGEAVFKQEDGTLLLNRLGRWDLIPRLFGLSNPRQLLKGEVVVKGWYRGGLTPSLEIHEVRADKTVRKSMVRSFRWASAILFLLIAIVISLALE